MGCTIYPIVWLVPLKLCNEMALIFFMSTLDISKIFQLVLLLRFMEQRSNGLISRNHFVFGFIVHKNEKTPQIYVDINSV